MGIRQSSYKFKRIFIRSTQYWLVTDNVKGLGPDKIIDAGIGAAQSSIYVTMSRTFQRGQLFKWQRIDKSDQTGGDEYVEDPTTLFSITRKF